MEHTLKNAQQNRLPPLRGHMYNTNRSQIKSQQSHDSQDQRITQAFRSKRQMNMSHDASNRGNMHEEEKYTPAQLKKQLERDP